MRLFRPSFAGLCALLLLPALVLAQDGAERSVDYTEALVDIATTGIYDPQGNVLNDLPPTPALPPDASFAPSASYQDSLIQNWLGQKDFQEQRLKTVRENLAQQRQRYDTLSGNVLEAQDKLVPLRQTIVSLKDQLELLNDQIRASKDRITAAELLVARQQLSLKRSMQDYQTVEASMGAQKKALLEYIRLLYHEESEYFGLYDEGSSTVKLLLADRSMSENLLGRDYLAVMESTGRQVFQEMESKRLLLQEKQAEINGEQQRLYDLYDALRYERVTLEQARVSQKELLAATQGEESSYQELLDESIRQQMEAAIAIQNLQDNLSLLESKLDSLDERLLDEGVAPPTEPITAPGPETPDAPQPSFVVPPPRAVFDWPVPPNVITAAFRDPTYPKRWGLHNAVDIRARQYTEIHAPANGYVFQVKDNGMGYSYIILAHKNQFMTVYGHVSEIIARPGTVVKRGEVIGLTGGTPGTRGAGLQTTGPHLHFEVYYKGKATDPLEYLPLWELKDDFLPAYYARPR